MKIGRILKHIKSRGFTLAELLVVCSIFFVVTTAGAISFSKYNTSQILDASTKEMVLYLNNAKTSAVTQVMPAGCNSSLQSYRVRITLPDTYEILAYCNGNGSVVTRKKLQGGIKFNSSATSPEITFQIGNGFSGGGKIKLDGSFASKTIDIDSAGNITIL